jgi:hypothetical protein
MIGMITGALVGRDVAGHVISEKAAKVLAWVGMILALLLVLSVAKCTYDKGVIEEYTAEQTAANAKADRKADQAAAEQRRVDDARLNQEATQLTEIANDPTVSSMDRRIARHRCIQLQQSARTNGSEPPSCNRPDVSR